MKKYRIDEITDNLDNLRKPLNSIERSKISKNKLYPYYGANNLMDYVDEYIFDEEILCVAEDGGSWGYREKCSYIVNEKCWVNNHAHVLRAKDNLNIAYLSYYLNYSDLSSSITGTTRGKLTKAALNSIEILLPELEVQNKIVKILDKAQDLIYKRKEQIATLDELVKSKFIEMFGDPVSNPKGWDVGKLGKISSVGSSKRVFVDELVSEGIPFYRGTEIGALSTGEKIEPTLFITKEHYEKLKDSTGVPVIGDLLMPSICPDGRIWSVDTQMPFYFKDGRVLWIHLENSSIDSMFLKHMLREKFNRDYNKIASGTTFAELKIFALKDLDIIMPPIEIQKKYSNFVKYTDKLKFEMEKSLKELEDNFNSLMEKAFNEELLK